MNAEEWIQREDEVAKQERIERLRWLLENTPQNEIWIFHAGFLNYELFEQTRYSFVYSQDLAVILLGLAFVEHTLAALLFASGRDELERGSLKVLIDEAFNSGLLNDEEKLEIDSARKIRNDITHFRKPTDSSSIEWQNEYDKVKILTLFKEEAKHMMQIVFHLVTLYSVR